MMWYERPENAGKVERLRKMFKNTPNDVIMEKLDISFSTLHRAARALGLTKSCGCAKPVPSAGRKPKEDKTVTYSELVELDAPVGDDWMFGKMGSKGLFARRR